MLCFSAAAATRPRSRCVPPAAVLARNVESADARGVVGFAVLAVLGGDVSNAMLDAMVFSPTR